MKPEHIELIKSTIPVLREHGVSLTTYFYQRMLKNHPELKNTFNLDHQTSGLQPRALAAAVLAYAEHIENPAVLSNAVERIANKHVSLNIQAAQYDIVGENLLHSISEVLNVDMNSELIAAWKEAYTQLAQLMISVEKQKYENLAQAEGGWAGWRSFIINSIEEIENGKRFTIVAQDQNKVIAANNGYISVLVHIPELELQQPQQFNVLESTENAYCFEASNKENAHHVEKALVEQYQIGDEVQVSAPQQR